MTKHKFPRNHINPKPCESRRFIPIDFINFISYKILSNNKRRKENQKEAIFSTN